jgi:hypothetical protein
LRIGRLLGELSMTHRKLLNFQYYLDCYLKVASLQVAYGALFGMTQPNAHKWLHILLIVLHQTLRDLGDAPARHLLTLRDRLAQLQTEQDDQTAPFLSRWHGTTDHPPARRC